MVGILVFLMLGAIIIIFALFFTNTISFNCVHKYSKWEKRGLIQKRVCEKCGFEDTV